METKILFTEINSCNVNLAEEDIKSLKKFVESDGVLVLFDNQETRIDFVRSLLEEIDNNYSNNIFIFREGNHGYPTVGSPQYSLPQAKDDIKRGYDRKRVTIDILEYLNSNGDESISIYAVGNNPITSLPMMSVVTNHCGESAFVGFNECYGTKLDKHREDEQRLRNYIASNEICVDTMDARLKLDKLLEEAEMFRKTIVKHMDVPSSYVCTSLSDFIESTILNSKGFKKAS